MKTRQDLYIYLNTKIQEIENDCNPEEISAHDIILSHYTLDIFEGKNEVFKIHIGKYQGKYYEGHKMHCNMGGNGCLPAIGKYRQPYDSIQELFQKNTVWYMEFFKKYRDHISTDFKNTLEYLCDFEKDGQKIQTLF